MMFFSKIDGLSVLLNYWLVLLDYLRATVYFWLFLKQSKIQSEYYDLQNEFAEVLFKKPFLRTRAKRTMRHQRQSVFSVNLQS